jgi:hypothetical protein
MANVRCLSQFALAKPFLPHTSSGPLDQLHFVLGGAAQYGGNRAAVALRRLGIWIITAKEKAAGATAAMVVLVVVVVEEVSDERGHEWVEAVIGGGAAGGRRYSWRTCRHRGAASCRRRGTSAGVAAAYPVCEGLHRCQPKGINRAMEEDRTVLERLDLQWKRLGQ